MNLPKITHTEPKTARGASYRYDVALRAYRRAYAGGGQYGFDMPTLRVNEPELYAYLQRMAHLANTL